MTNTLEEIEAYPLHWPPGRPRTEPVRRRSANFHRITTESRPTWDGKSTTTWRHKQTLTVADSRDRMRVEIERLGGRGVIISSNLELRNDGLPRSGQRDPGDPGIAVYFRFNGQPHCLSCDVWDRVADNLAAIAKHVEAMRGQLRWGVADVASLFAGFKALPGAVITPATMTVEQAARYVAAQANPDRAPIPDALITQSDAFQSSYRAAARRLHPDANGGEHSPAWNHLQQAAAILREHHRESAAAS